MTALDSWLFGFNSWQWLIYHQIRSKNNDRIPESGQWRCPQSLKEVVVAPGILSLKNHLAPFVLRSYSFIGTTKIVRKQLVVSNDIIEIANNVGRILFGRIGRIGSKIDSLGCFLRFVRLFHTLNPLGLGMHYPTPWTYPMAENSFWNLLSSSAWCQGMMTK